MQEIKNIKNLKIIDIKNIHDYLQLILESNIIINIFNNYTFKNDNNNIDNFLFKKILSVNKKIDSIIINFPQEEYIEISLLDKDYNGPEAFEIIDKSEGKIIIV